MFIYIFTLSVLRLAIHSLQNLYSGPKYSIGRFIPVDFDSIYEALQKCDRIAGDKYTINLLNINSLKSKNKR